MKIRVGIVGYGNLGRAVEEEVLASKSFKLIAIFSRRNVKSKFNSLIEPSDRTSQYKGKIDVMILCGGSASDIENQLPEIAQDFCCVNSFDTHSKLKILNDKCNEICKRNKTVSLSACGWDPGLFSIIRTYMYAFSGSSPTTFWGKGISMGHSDAIRRVDNVVDGVQFTMPNKKAENLAKQGVICDDEPNHFRQCYVLANQKHHLKIEKTIKNIPNYFKGQPTSVEFVDAIKLSKLKSKMSHSGKIVSPFRLKANQKAYFEFVLKTDSNPMLTAKIMLRFAMASRMLYVTKKFGAYLPIDISPRLLLSEKEYFKVISELV